jgi:hypothetical protein
VKIYSKGWIDAENGEGMILMTSLEGRSHISICLQPDHFEVFYEGVNSNMTGIRQEGDMVESSDKMVTDNHLKVRIAHEGFLR